VKDKWPKTGSLQKSPTSSLGHTGTPAHSAASPYKGATPLPLSFMQPAEKGSISRLTITALEHMLAAPFQGKAYINCRSLNMRFNYPVLLSAASPLTSRHSTGRKTQYEPVTHLPFCSSFLSICSLQTSK